MHRVWNASPVDYSLCNQTVTLYHGVQGDPFSCTRVVFKGAFLDLKKVQSVDKTGSRETSMARESPVARLFFQNWFVRCFIKILTPFICPCVPSDYFPARPNNSCI